MRRLAEDVRHRAIGPDLAARLAVVVGAMAYVASDFATAAIELGAADHLPADDHVFRSRAAMSRAVLRADLGEHAGALAEAARAIDEARASGRARIIGLALGAASYTAFAAGDADLARQRAEERVAVEPPGHHGHVYALIDIAYSLLDLDQIDDARAKAADAFTAAQRLGNAQARAEACRCLAWCALIDGQPGGAAGQLLEQLAVFERTDGMIDRVIEVVLGAALVVALTGDASRAAELWRQGQQLHVNLGVAYGNWPRRLRELAAAHGLALALPPAEPTELRPVLRTTVDVLQAAVADMARS
jgi:hypothetical protein